jgi:hypothetical protein
MKNLFLLLTICLLTGTIFAQTRTKVEGQREELGKVSWFRDYDEALSASKEANKPVLILFQEVPGCATCQRYGNSTLSHPLMVEAIENEFIPLAIFNNKGGADKKILDKYGEPAWNNPVVRIVDSKGDNLIGRVAGNYSPQGLFDAMVKTIKIEGGTIPGYMEALGLELTAEEAPVKEAYFQMYCFWSGEHHLGNLDGVFTTEPGFMSGHEVVKIEYNPEEVSEKELAQYASKKDIKPIDKADGYRTSKKDRFYQLQQTDLRFLPLTQVQKTKINAAYGRGEDLLFYLSPSQLAYYMQIKAGQTDRTELYTTDFVTAWKKMIVSKK